MKILKINCICFACCSLFSSCAFHQQSDLPTMTQLQIREIQTRELETSDKKLVMKSIMNVLQDEGFIIKNAVADVGLLSAEKNIDIENHTKAFLAKAFVGPHARWSKQQVLEASAHLSEFGKKTRVRINCQIKTLDNFGQPREVVTIMNSLYYQDFFDKVSKGVFIQEQGI
jgi:hypothetical protein